jgi:hypothetical protein
VPVRRAWICRGPGLATGTASRSSAGSLSFSLPRGIIRSRLRHRGRRGEHAGCVAGHKSRRWGRERVSSCTGRVDAVFATARTIASLAPEPVRPCLGGCRTVDLADVGVDGRPSRGSKNGVNGPKNTGSSTRSSFAGQPQHLLGKHRVRAGQQPDRLRLASVPVGRSIRDQPSRRKRRGRGRPPAVGEPGCRLAMHEGVEPGRFARLARRRDLARQR